MEERLWEAVALVLGVAVGANWNKIKKHTRPWLAGSVGSLTGAIKGSGKMVKHGYEATSDVVATGWKSASGAVTGLFFKKPARKQRAKAEKAPSRRRSRPTMRTVPVAA